VYDTNILGINSLRNYFVAESKQGKKQVKWSMKWKI